MHRVFPSCHLINSASNCTENSSSLSQKIFETVWKSLYHSKNAGRNLPDRDFATLEPSEVQLPLKKCVLKKKFKKNF